MGVKRYARNEGLFGAAGQAKIAATKVAVIGLGGLGAPVIQQLAYLGVRDYGLVEFDIVTDSSLNRLVGAIDADVAAGSTKLAVAERMIRAIQPDAVVATVNGKVDSPQAEALIAVADVVFSCVDRDLARLQTTKMCARHAKPAFDLATDTGVDDESWYGGRIVFSDGTRCAVCLGLLDQRDMARDLMSSEQLDTHDRVYGINRTALGDSGPMLISVNGVVASLAVMEFIGYVTGLREPAGQLTYRGDLQVIRRSMDQPEPGCYYCAGLWG